MSIKSIINKVKTKVIESEPKHGYVVIYINHETGTRFVDEKYLTKREIVALQKELETDKELDVWFNSQSAVAVI